MVLKYTDTLKHMQSALHVYSKLRISLDCTCWQISPASPLHCTAVGVRRVQTNMTICTSVYDDHQGHNDCRNTCRKHKD